MVSLMAGPLLPSVLIAQPLKKNLFFAASLTLFSINRGVGAHLMGKAGRVYAELAADKEQTCKRVDQPITMVA